MRRIGKGVRSKEFKGLRGGRGEVNGRQGDLDLAGDMGHRDTRPRHPEGSKVSFGRDIARGGQGSRLRLLPLRSLLHNVKREGVIVLDHVSHAGRSIVVQVTKDTGHGVIVRETYGTPRKGHIRARERHDTVHKSLVIIVANFGRSNIATVSFSTWYELVANEALLGRDLNRSQWLNWRRNKIVSVKRHAPSRKDSDRRNATHVLQIVNEDIPLAKINKVKQSVPAGTSNRGFEVRRQHKSNPGC